MSEFSRDNYVRAGRKIAKAAFWWALLHIGPAALHHVGGVPVALHPLFIVTGLAASGAIVIVGWLELFYPATMARRVTRLDPIAWSALIVTWEMLPDEVRVVAEFAHVLQTGLSLAAPERNPGDADGSSPVTTTQ